MHYHPRRLVLPLVLVLVFAFVLLATAPPARAANPSAGNQNQLINAINAVNSAGAGSHTISLTADITLTATLPALTNTAAAEIVFDGDGHTLTGDGSHTILKINPGVTVSVRDVTLTGGEGDSSPAGNQGGAIYNRGRLTVKDTRLYHNSAAGGGAIYTYGGTGNTADLVLTRVLFESNGDYGGQYGGGAGLAAVADGGEVSVAVSQSVFRSNSATASGGAIMINGSGGEAQLTMDTTAITFNTTMGAGGGLVISSNGGVAAALLINSTIVENEGFRGGGIAVYENGGTAELGLVFSTVNSNQMSFAGSAIYNAGGAITTAASIIGASGYTPACANEGDGAFTLTSSGYNLGDDGSCDLDAATDIPSGQPRTAYARPVAATYGQTYVAPIDALSDAQQVIPAGVLGCGTTIGQDQRGEPRPAPAGKCDIGAYESDAVTTCASPLTAADEAGLNFAIACANIARAGTHTITLTADFTLSTDTRRFSNAAVTEIILDGNGHTIDAGGIGPIVMIESDTTVRVRDITLTNAQYSAVTNLGTLTIENSQLINNAGNSGAGVESETDATIIDCTFTGNSASYGGAVALRTQNSPATLIIRNSTITNNEAQFSGGGVYVISHDLSAANITLDNVTIDGNRSTNGTGGLDLGASEGGELTANIVASRIVNNTGKRGGLGIIALGSAEVTLAGSTVAGNKSNAHSGIGVESSAGGVYVRANDSGTTALTIVNSTLSGNTTPRAGGGLLVTANGGTARTTVSYSTLADNTSATGGGGIHTATDGSGTATVTLSATIVTNGAGAGPDCARPSGSILSNGYNLAGDGTCFLTQTGDLPASAAGLLPLALNAPGTTPTHALSDSSPALDRIPTGALGCGAAVAADQRGAARPQPAGGACDIGAYEQQGAGEIQYRLLLPMINR